MIKSDEGPPDYRAFPEKNREENYVGMTQIARKQTVISIGREK